MWIWQGSNNSRPLYKEYTWSLDARKPPWAEGSGGDTAATQLQDGTAQAVLRATPTPAQIQGEGADREDSYLNLILDSNVVTSNKVEHVPILQQQNSTSRNSHGYSQGGTSGRCGAGRRFYFPRLRRAVGYEPFYLKKPESEVQAAARWRLFP